MTTQRQRIVLAQRPQGTPGPEHFRLETQDIPALSPGQIRVKNQFLSLDPYMRGRMSDAPSYAAPVEIGEVMVGGTVGLVEESQSNHFKAGDQVVTFGGWQSHSVVPEQMAQRLPTALTQPSLALSSLGMPGFTAYMGLTDIGQPQPGETVVVAAASGPVGSVVGQVAKLKGCRVVGIAGGETKCQYVQDVLGFDACLDHKTPDLAGRLARHCPDGIDIYFENVGGRVFDAVLPLLNPKARIPLCGLVSQYNQSSLPNGPDRMGQLMGQLLVKRVKVQGFIIFDDYGHRYGEFLDKMLPWVQAGPIKMREDHVQGLAQAPEAFIGMLSGQNFGKLIVDL